LNKLDTTRLLLSFLIATISALVAFEAIGETRTSPKKLLWTGLAGATLGVGIWSTHFNAMLVWHTAFKRNYDTRLILVSVVIAVAASWCGLQIVHGALKSSLARRLMAALILGAGIDAMHFAGMGALHLTPSMCLSRAWAFASIGLGTLCCYVALTILRRSEDLMAGVIYRLAGAALFGLAVCGVHLLSMHAMMLTVGTRSIVTSTNLGGTTLATMGICNVFVFAFGLLTLAYRKNHRWMQVAHEAQLRADESVRTAERLATAGKIAASIAHEINNPLEAVTNLLYLVQGESSDVERQSYITQAQTEVGRISEITTHTLKFYRQQSAPELTAIPDLFETAIALFRRRLEQSGIHLQRMWEPDVPSIVCRAGEIRQVLANLISNAIDAMPTGGTLRLSLLSTEPEGLEIKVADTGCGMSEDTQKKVLEPFFTTKGVHGTGLGLSISTEIIERHGGNLILTSSTDAERHGTEFCITLPCRMEHKQTTFVYDLQASPIINASLVGTS